MEKLKRLPLSWVYLLLVLILLTACFVELQVFSRKSQTADSAASKLKKVAASSSNSKSKSLTTTTVTAKVSMAATTTVQRQTNETSTTTGDNIKTDTKEVQSDTSTTAATVATPPETTNRPASNTTTTTKPKTKMAILIAVKSMAMKAPASAKTKKTTIDTTKSKITSITPKNAKKPAKPKTNPVRVSRGDERKDVETIVREIGSEYWSDQDQLDALVWIYKHESVRPGVVSRTGCKGLFQLKNPPKWMVLGDAASEAKAGCEYIKRRYKSPLKAKSFWLDHHWY